MKNILLIGCGDIAQRLIPHLVGRYRVLALLRPSSSDYHARAQALRALGVRVLRGDLDDRRTLLRLRGLAYCVVDLAPPTSFGVHDRRTQNLLAQMRHSYPAIVPQRQQKSLILQRKTPASMTHGPRQARQLIYVSTTGVYGDCQGAWIDETRPIQPHTHRAQRRASAELQIRQWGRGRGRCAQILRLPGIYAADRLPLSRFNKQTPLIVAEEDSWGNHIHADDVCRAILAVLLHHAPNRVYNVCDQTPMLIGDYYDAIADAFGYSRLPRLSKQLAQQAHGDTLWSYMQESRRISSARLLLETRWRPQHPDVRVAFHTIAQKIITKD